MTSTDGWVTVAEAAKIMTARGDKIDPSNVSRYLARWPVIPSKRDGRVRLVEIAALIEHRSKNVFVADKQAARGTETAGRPATLTMPQAAPRPEPEPLELTAPEGDASLADINRQIKLLDLRQRQRDDDVAVGKLIPADEVLVLISTAMNTMVQEFGRQEVNIAQKYGRDVSIEFRKARKAAQAQASATLIDLARKNMPPALAAQITTQSVEVDEPQESII